MNEHGGGKAMKCLLLVIFGVTFFLGGCGTINAQRSGYMNDKVYVSRHYLGEALAEPEFKEYGIKSSYKIKDGELKLYLDPYERYSQLKKRYAVNNKVYYVRTGPHGYSPGKCFFSVVTVLPMVFAVIDSGDRRLIKKWCNKTYEWERKNEELPAVLDGEGREEIIRRDYKDSDGNISAEVKVGKRAIKVDRLTGFKGVERGGPYVWNLNKIVNFSFFDVGDEVSINIEHYRKGEYFINEMNLGEEESEEVIFRDKYDGAFRLKYTCRLCNANLKDNFYTDQEVLIWTTGIYYYKGRGSLDFVASCIEKRFDNLRNGDVWVEEASTPARVYKDHQYLYDNDAYVMVRGVRTPREPDIDDIRSCIREKSYLDLEVVAH